MNATPTCASQGAPRAVGVEVECDAAVGVWLAPNIALLSLKTGVLLQVQLRYQGQSVTKIQVGRPVQVSTAAPTLLAAQALLLSPKRALRHPISGAHKCAHVPARTMRTPTFSHRALHTQVSLAGTAPPASCFCRMTQQLVFLGSWSGDSMLIQFLLDSTTGGDALIVAPADRYVSVLQWRNGGCCVCHRIRLTFFCRSGSGRGGGAI